MAKKVKYYIGGIVLITIAIVLSLTLIVPKTATHLDENYKSLGKVTSFILKQDNNWTDIPNGHFLRIQFEKKLSKDNKILIYVKGNGVVEVYKKGAKTKIVEFIINSNEGFYSVILSSMTGVNTDTFDLKSIGDISYDYITSPVDKLPIKTTYCGKSIVNNINYDYCYSKYV
jgi:hypothetical protein